MVPSLRSTQTSVAVFLFLAGLAVAACGSSAASPAGREPGAAPPAATTGGQGQGAGQGQGGQAGEPGKPGTGDPGPVAVQPGDDATAVLPDGTKIVYRGTLSLRVSDVDAAVKAGRQVVAGVGGYLSGSRQSREGDDAVASITYRIPADRWEEALEALRALGSVVGEATDAEEVTGQLVDLEARIRNLRASEAAIQRLTEDATGVDELLNVESRLADLRGQIEQLDAQRLSLSDRAALGTLTVTFGKVVAAIVEAAEETGWDARKDVSEATSTLAGMLQALTSAGIWFGIVWLPILLGLAVLAVIGRFVLRRSGLLDGMGRTGMPEA